MTQTAVQTDGVRIHSLIQNPPQHPKHYLYNAFHRSYPCYVASDAHLQNGAEIPLSKLQQCFNAGVQGVTTYIYKPEKRQIHDPTAPSEVFDFEAGKEVLGPNSRI